jgi:signal transduction histidine kinase
MGGAEEPAGSHGLAPDELSQRAEELRILLDVAPVGIFIAHDSACAHMTVNAAGAAMLQVPPHVNPSLTGPDARSQPFRVLRCGVEVAPHELPMQRAAASGECIVGEELDILRQDGTLITLWEYASPLFDDAGRPRGSLGVFVDITDRKRGEAALRDVDRRKDQFLAMLSHELRTPLSPIMMAVELLKQKNHEDFGLRRLCDTIMRQTERLAGLVEDLLDVSRIKAGKLRLQKSDAELATILLQAIEASTPLIEQRHHVLSVTTPQSPVVLDVDAGRIVQVISNLLNNSAKYSDEGHHIELVARLEGPTASISIRDEGVGIPEHRLEQIFEPFAQVENPGITNGGGLGLGLPLARYLVELHGGTLEAHSAGNGRGSEFVVRLPVESDGVSSLVDA